MWETLTALSLKSIVTPPSRRDIRRRSLRLSYAARRRAGAGRAAACRRRAVIAIAPTFAPNSKIPDVKASNALLFSKKIIWLQDWPPA
jgi:hypothetical protein